MKAWASGRWLAAAAAWLALSATVWLAGDAIVVAGTRPLDAPLARVALVAIVAVLWLGWELWRAQRAIRANQRLLDGLARGVADGDSAERAAHELSLLRQRFEEALRVLRKARFRGPTGERQTVAQLPWYMFIGAPGSGKTTALLNAGLRFPLGDPRGDALQGVGGTRNCDWWFTSEAVLLDTAGRYTTQDSDREGDAAAWLGFLDLLKSYRPRQPLNGALVTLSMSDLAHWNDEELQRYAGHVRERIAELRQRLAVRLPVYVLVTKVDLLAGFNEFFSGFDAEQRAQVWGVTFDATEMPAGRPTVTRFADEFARLERRLYAMLPGRLHEERDLQRRASIYRFPQQFRISGPLISRFLDAAFGGAGGEATEDSFLRGVYFTSGTQEGSPIDRVLGTLARTFNLERKVQPPAPGTGKSFFLRRLLREVILGEAGLAGVDTRLERRRRRALAAAFGALAVGTLVLAALWSASYLQNRDLVVAARASTAAVRDELSRQADLRAGDEARLIALLDRLRALRASVDPSTGFLHVAFGQGGKLGGQATRVYRNALRDSLVPHAVSSLEDALRTRPSAGALDAYLAIYGERRPDEAAISRTLAGIWSLPASANEALAQHLRTAFEEHPVVVPHGKDEELVEAARRRLGSAARL